jgi:hypothetical protein
MKTAQETLQTNSAFARGTTFAAHFRAVILKVKSLTRSAQIGSVLKSSCGAVVQACGQSVVFVWMMHVISGDCLQVIVKQEDEHALLRG